jgi:transcriptional regulator with XRE-family HTH domain
MDMVRFGRGIRALRMRRGWRQVDLAVAAGVSQSIVSRIERGLGGRIAVETLSRVAQALAPGSMFA